MESNRLLLCPRYKDNECLHKTYTVCILFKNHLHDFFKIKIKFRKNVLTFGQGLKCEHTLICIVIDGLNVSKFSQCGCNVSTVLTPCSQCGRHAAVILACVRNVMLCYVIWLFVKRLSQEAIQRRSQRDRLVKIKVFKLRRDADDIPCNITLRSAGGESFHSAGPTTA